MTGQFDRDCPRCGCHLTENATDEDHDAECPRAEPQVEIPDALVFEWTRSLAFNQTLEGGRLFAARAAKWARDQERERCAKIAEAELQRGNDPYCCDTVAENIAAEIRKGTP